MVTSVQFPVGPPTTTREGTVRRAFLFAFLFLSCKDDPAEPADCSDTPDFIVLVSALDAPLPADTVVSIEYGGSGMEQDRIPDDLMHGVLFCDPSDREGNPVPANGGHGGESAASDPGGQGGAGGSPTGHGLEALRCELWTRGPATVTVETKAYPVPPPLSLEAKKGQCTVESEIILQHDDGGM
jgi:hypothetical protein